MRALLASLVYHRGTDNTCWHSDDGVAQNHDGTGKEAAEDCDRGDVAIAHSGESDDSPINARWDVGELSVWLIAFNHIHQGAENHHQYYHKQEIHSNLSQTLPYALQEQETLIDEGKEPQHTEDADESERSQDEEVASAGEERNEG